MINLIEMVDPSKRGSQKMIKHVSRLSISAVIICFGLLPGAFFVSANAQSGNSSDDQFWTSIYEKNHVVEIDIRLTQEAWNSMQPARNQRRSGPPNRGRGPGGPSESQFTYVKADVSIDGQAFESAGLRFKGNSSYRFASNGYKRPMKIDTNRFVKGQKLHGRTKLNLSNSFLDSAYMKEKLGYEIYRAAGVPSPGVGWATVTLTIDGVTQKRPLGIYVLVEQVDKHFVKSNFGDAAKNSLVMKPEISSNWEYPGDNPKLYEPFGIKMGEDNVESIKRFGDLLQLIHRGSDADFEREISNRMDLDQFAGYLAATSLLASIDSYIGMPHNYYLLVDETDDKLRLFPWDVNESFGTFTIGSSPETLVDWDIDQPWVANLTLVQRLFGMESFRSKYRSKMTQLMKDTFTEEHLFARITEYEKALTSHLEGRDLAAMRMGIEGNASGYNTAVERRVLAIKPFIQKRAASVAAQLAGTREGSELSNRRRGGPGGRRRGF